MKIKKGDTILIIAGKDRGKTGKVDRVVIAKEKKGENKVIAEGINIVKKHVRPKREGQKGERVEISFPLAVSKVMLVCPECKKPVRVSYKVAEKGGKKRICKKCRAILK